MQEIEDFLLYLEEWENMYPVEGRKKTRPGFLTWSTLVGLKVSLKGTLELLKYVTEECNFRYLMTARLNQDNLEVRCSSIFCFLIHLSVGVGI